MTSTSLLVKILLFLLIVFLITSGIDIRFGGGRPFHVRFTNWQFSFGLILITTGALLIYIHAYEQGLKAGTRINEEIQLELHPNPQEPPPIGHPMKLIEKEHPPDSHY